jgi:hypothetical protein
VRTCRLEGASHSWESIRKTPEVIPAELHGIFDIVDHVERAEPARRSHHSDEPGEHRVSFSDKTPEQSTKEETAYEAFIHSLGCTDVLRQRKIVASPDVDMQIQLDRGTGSAAVD